MPGTWIITIAPDRPAAQIQQDLTKAGCAIKNVLTEVGVIIAQCDDDKVSSLRTISGVVDVSPDTSINLGPPDSPITW